MTMRKKLLITIACLSCILCILVTGTIAWLIAETTPITNTFAPSNIFLTLTETPTTFDGKMIPGKTMAKKATVTVNTDIPCYVFVEITKTNDVDAFIGYAVNVVKTEGETTTGTWTLLKEETGKAIYYKEVKQTGSYEFNILTAGTVKIGTIDYTWAEDQVLVLPSVTKPMMDALYKDGKHITDLPTLTFKASAIQSDHLAYGDANTEAEQALVAWETLKANPNPPAAG